MIRAGVRNVKDHLSENPFALAPRATGGEAAPATPEAANASPLSRPWYRVLMCEETRPASRCARARVGALRRFLRACSLVVVCSVVYSLPGLAAPEPVPPDDWSSIEAGLTLLAGGEAEKASKAFAEVPWRSDSRDLARVLQELASGYAEHERFAGDNPQRQSIRAWDSLRKAAREAKSHAPDASTYRAVLDWIGTSAPEEEIPVPLRILRCHLRLLSGIRAEDAKTLTPSKESPVLVRVHFDLLPEMPLEARRRRHDPPPRRVQDRGAPDLSEGPGR